MYRFAPNSGRVGGSACGRVGRRCGRRCCPEASRCRRVHGRGAGVPSAAASAGLGQPPGLWGTIPRLWPKSHL